MIRAPAIFAVTITLAVLAVVAQVMLPHRHVVAHGAVSVTPASISGLAWWWVASDLPVGQPASNWVDRIQHLSWTNYSGSATVPTNTVSGLFFLGSDTQFLLTTNMVVYNPSATNDATFVVLLTRTGTGAFQTFLSYNNGGDFNWQWDNTQWEVYKGGTKYFGTTTPTTNIWFDWAFTTAKSGTTNYSIAWTNAVPYNTNSVYFLDSGNTKFGKLGGITSQQFTGYIKELLIYTNSVGHTNIASIHQYFTNTYPGILSP